jgi:hypothetical protein
MNRKTAITKRWVLVVMMLALVIMGGCSTPAAEPGDVPQAPSATEASTAGETTGDAEDSTTNADGADSADDGGSGSAPAATLTPIPGSGSLELTEALPDAYDDALSARNQLALGTLLIAGADQAVTPEQAQELKLYWQALKALGTSSTTASAETAAVQTQILETMTPEQIAAIAAMQLTNEDLNAYYVEQGIELTTPEPGVTPQGMGGRNSGMSQEEREAARATSEAAGTPVSTGGGGGNGAARRDILIDNVIALLETVGQ